MEVHWEWEKAGKPGKRETRDRFCGSYTAGNLTAQRNASWDSTFPLDPPHLNNFLFYSRLVFLLQQRELTIHSSVPNSVSSRTRDSHTFSHLIILFLSKRQTGLGVLNIIFSTSPVAPIQCLNIFCSNCKKRQQAQEGPVPLVSSSLGSPPHPRALCLGARLYSKLTFVSP